MRKQEPKINMFCVLSFLLFWLLNNRLNDLLSSEEVPHAASVKLISKWVEESVEDGICFCQNWKHLQAETNISTISKCLM